MNISTQFIIFNVDENLYAIPLLAVEKVIHSVEVSPVSKAPDIMLGLINFHGNIIPLLDVRKRFKLPERKVDIQDQFIIVRTLKRTVALFVDSVQNVFDYRGNDISPENNVPDIEHIDGTLKLENGIALIQNLDKFLYPDEENMLDDIDKIKESLIKK
ncbi:MAG: chemotaxis protein CheW [Candidatus Brocadiales bacterium]|nr:chemotaxis protein CheW [Candidatus Brocadiales bacterium]